MRVAEWFCRPSLYNSIRKEGYKLFRYSSIREEVKVPRYSSIREEVKVPRYTSRIREEVKVK